MKKIFFLSIAILMMVVAPAQAQNKNKANAIKKAAPNVEVLYFHGKQRCATCIAIGNGTQELLNSSFQQQIKNGKIKFKEVDISTPDGEKLADSYRVAGSALYLTQYIKGKENRNDLTSFGFATARTNPSEFKKQLKEKIENLLK